jgi:3'-phosphoadenosine 5'-phosphosulfate sulfotransferase (PAPS reductase)/FAD synthetase
VTLQHFVSISGGKDSTATACLAIERMQRRPDFRPRFQFADVENEDQITLDHIDYLANALGIEIERLSAYDVPGLIDAEAFARKRRVIAENWPREFRRTRHVTGCNKGPDCGCPVIVSPAVAPERIAQAIEALQPSGNAYLDMCLIHGRFPSKKAKFCTDELKMQPINLTRQPIWDAGGVTVDWVGERALESKPRAGKPMLQRTRMIVPGSAKIIWRPIHKWTAAQTFEIAKRHGLRPNPLYLMGAGRVGCWPCINARKKEIKIIARNSPAKIVQLRDWERRVSIVSRRDASGEGMFSTFFSADKVPGDPSDWNRAQIDKVVEWTQTTRGGRQFDMIQAIDDLEADEMGLQCDSEYGLCE